jgi:hypothetical protein
MFFLYLDPEPDLEPDPDGEKNLDPDLLKTKPDPNHCKLLWMPKRERYGNGTVLCKYRTRNPATYRYSL